MNYFRSLMVLGTFLAAGCAARTPDKYLSEPSSVTLESAMEQVTNGLQKMVARRMEAEQQGVYQQLGLHAAEVIITFNVTGSSTAADKLFVDLSVAQPMPKPNVIANAGKETTVTETASRGNQITIRFVNLLFAEPNTLVGKIDGHDLHRLRYAISGKDPGPIGPLPTQDPTVVRAASATPAGDQPREVRPGALPDLPPVATAAGNQTLSEQNVADSPEFKALLQRLREKRPATQPTSQPSE